jgi:hypothetical protein
VYQRQCAGNHQGTLLGDRERDCHLQEIHSGVLYAGGRQDHFHRLQLIYLPLFIQAGFAYHKKEFDEWVSVVIESHNGLDCGHEDIEVEA